jgi:hypothetical protein
MLVLLILLIFPAICSGQNNLLPALKNEDGVMKLDKDSISVENAVPMQRDTFDFRWKFQVGDTLEYEVMSRDSLFIDYGSPLLRIRMERIRITCDSLTSDGDYCLTHTLIAYKAKESFEEEKNVSRNSSPWVNVPVHIVMDSLGIRKNAYNRDVYNAAVSPGGPFQPYILLQLDSPNVHTWKLTNESWMVGNTIDVPENAMPVPALRYTMFWRMIGLMDTLDFTQVLKMTFAMTSQGSMVVRSEDVNMVTTSVNNAVGEIFWDTDNWVPKLYTHTVEQKLTINNRDSQGSHTDPGFHYIYSTFVLDKFVRR